MADIAMCRDHECPSRVHCYRYRAKPNQYRQSYAGYHHKGERCDAYLTTAGWSDFALVPLSALEWKAKVESEKGDAGER